MASCPEGGAVSLELFGFSVSFGMMCGIGVVRGLRS